MTALKPSETWKITPLQPDEERKFLRRQVASPVCCHPDCDKPTESVHHAWPQGFIQSSSYVVRVEGEDKPVFHAIGLCGSGTTGHHGDLEDHRAWLKYEDGVWNWYEQITRQEIESQGLNFSEYGQSNTLWRLVGPLDPQPGQLTHKKARRKREKQPSRSRKSVTVNVPSDEQENGAGVLDDLIQTGRELWAQQLGWTESVPAYYVIVAAFAKAFSER